METIGPNSTFAAAAGTPYAAEAAAETYLAGGNAADAAVGAAGSPSLEILPAGRSLSTTTMRCPARGSLTRPSGPAAARRPSFSSTEPGCDPSSGGHRQPYQAP